MHAQKTGTMKKITLSIPEPCHQNWNEMTPTQQGRFCGSCQKQVIDFTAMTDDELFRFFANKSTGSVCGRTLPVQLDTPIAKPVEHKKKKFWYISYLTSLLLFFGKQEAKAQAKVPVTTSPVTKLNEELNRVGGIRITNDNEPVKKRVLTGTVKDEQGNPIQYASIIADGTSRGAMTDSTGNYKLIVKPGDRLKITAIGFETTIVPIAAQTVQNITLAAVRAWMGEIAIVNTTPSGDYVAPDVPRHTAEIKVIDNATSSPIANATVHIVRNSQNKQKTRHTSSKGYYELRNIKETDSYRLTIAAAGYKEQHIVVNGSDFTKRKMERLVELEKIQEQILMGKITATDTKVLTETNNEISIAEALKGRMGCGIVVNVPPLQKKPEGADIADSLQGKVGGISVTTVRVKNKQFKPNPVRQFFTTVVKKVTPCKTTASINAYPNPVATGGDIAIKTNNVKAGNYILSITSAAGEVIYSSPVQVAKNSSSLSLNTVHPKNTGIYVIRLISASGTEEASCRLVVQ
jgi:hypothetical protein